MQCLKRAKLSGLEVPFSLICNPSIAYSMGVWYPHRKGFDYKQPDLPLKVWLREGAKGMVRESKKLVEEAKNTYNMDRIRRLQANNKELRIHWRFNNAEALNEFQVNCDRDHSRGHSWAELISSNNQTGLFRGYLDTKVPQDGTTFRTGYANIMSPMKERSFNRMDVHDDWGNDFTHLALKIRGDGRTYMLILNAPGPVDISWHDQFQYPLYTHGGPYWQYALIPFSRFIFVVHGRIQDKQHASYQGHLQQMGITLMDRITGKFQLEIDWIGVYKDVTHTEKFAYETYLTEIAML